MRRLRESFSTAMPLIHLGHPAVAGVLPPSLMTILTKGENQMLFHSARRVVACYAGFEEWRTGTASVAPADAKAAKQHSAIFESAKAWGARFGVKKLDETTAAKLVEALSTVQGGATLSITDPIALKAMYGEFQRETQQLAALYN